MFIESFKMAISSILGNKARSFLTVLGVVIGVGSVILMLSLGEGVKKQVADLAEGFGTNIMAVVPGKIEKGKAFNPVSTIGVSTLTEKDVTILKDKADKVDNVSPLSLTGGALVYNGNTSNSAIIVSTTPSFINALSSIKVDKGRFITNEDLEKNKKVIVIGSTVKESLFKDEDPVGKIVKFRNIDFEIIGYLKTQQQAIKIGDVDSGAWSIIPRTTSTEITGSSQIFRIAMNAKASEDIGKAVDQVKSVVLESHQGTEDFSVLTQEDLIGIVGDILNLLTLLVAGIASISLAVGGIGIMNMMLVTVTERTKEIGIRKAVGAKNIEILIQFLIEAVVISFLGGFLGILTAFGLGILVEKILGILPVITLNFVVIAFSISFIVGVIFGLAPAIRASRKDPIEALRYE